MAAASGLFLLSIVVTVLHFVIVLGVAPLMPRLTRRLRGSVQIHVIYQDGRGILRDVLQTCDLHNWHLTSLATDTPGTAASGEVGITMTLSGVRVLEAGRVLAGVEGVSRIDQLYDDAE